VSSRTVRLGIAAAAALAVAAPPAGAASYPKVEQLVVFRDGSTLQKPATAKHVSVKVGGRTCTVPAGTALAALVRIDPPKLALRDYGSCSTKAADAAGLFVRRIGPDTNKGFDGWVYKVNQKIATTGAADPSGPFGSGRLKSGRRITWFYCHLDQETRNCQRTLGLKATATAPGQVTVVVRSYADSGKSVPAAGATVTAGDVTATADDHGSVVLSLPAGTHSVHATRSGEIRSFAEEVQVG
jgi:hypothetical protein